MQPRPCEVPSPPPAPPLTRPRETARHRGAASQHEGKENGRQHHHPADPGGVPGRHRPAHHGSYHRRHRGRGWRVADALVSWHGRGGPRAAGQRRDGQAIPGRELHRSLGSRTGRGLSERGVGDTPVMGRVGRAGAQGRARQPRRVLEDQRQGGAGRGGPVATEPKMHFSRARPPLPTFCGHSVALATRRQRAPSGTFRRLDFLWIKDICLTLPISPKLEVHPARQIRATRHPLPSALSLDSDTTFLHRSNEFFYGRPRPWTMSHGASVHFNRCAERIPCSSA